MFVDTWLGRIQAISIFASLLSSQVFYSHYAISIFLFQTLLIWYTNENFRCLILLYNAAFSLEQLKYSIACDFVKFCLIEALISHSLSLVFWSFEKSSAVTLSLHTPNSSVSQFGEKRKEKAEAQFWKVFVYRKILIVSKIVIHFIYFIVCFNNYMEWKK